MPKIINKNNNYALIRESSLLILICNTSTQIFYSSRAIGYVPAKDAALGLMCSSAASGPLQIPNVNFKIALILLKHKVFAIIHLAAH